MTPGEAYTAAEAARVLELSPKRVRQLAEEGRLDVVQSGPLRVSAVSVLRTRDARRAASTEGRAGGAAPGSPPPPDSLPGTDLVPLLTSIHEQLLAATQREKGEAIARALAERDAETSRAAWHEERALRQQAERERDEARDAARRAQDETREAREEAARASLRTPAQIGEAPGEGGRGGSTPTPSAPTPAPVPVQQVQQRPAGALARLFGRH